MPAKKIIIALLIILVAVGGFVAGLYLLRERQDLTEKAAVPGGKATVSLEPSSGTFNVGDTIQGNIYFDTANIAISGIAIRLTYPYSGTTPEVSINDITINSAIANSPDWTCPTKNSNPNNGNMIIDIACANTSAAGYTTAGKTELATITLKVNQKPSVSPLTLRFDPSLSIITQKSDGRDILLIPTSTGSYTIGGVTTPTSGVTSTPTPTTKITGTVTPTTKLSATPTPTSSVETLPDAGISYPTLLAVGVGILIIFGAVLLAI